MGEIWDNKHAKRQKRAADVLRGSAGKGDKRRPTNEKAFSLGLKMVKIAETIGKDSKEYKDTEKAWREAVRKGH